MVGYGRETLDSAKPRCPPPKEPTLSLLGVVREGRSKDSKYIVLHTTQVRRPQRPRLLLHLPPSTMEAAGSH